MKKENIFLLIMMAVSLFIFTGTVYAAGEENTCSAKQLSELRQIAANIKVSYLPKTEVVQSEYEDVEVGATSYTKRYLDIKIYNMNTKLYIEATNDIGYEMVVTANDLASDGTITFRQEPLDQKVNYIFYVKSDKYGCETATLRTIRLTLPMYNAYSQLDICSEIPDYYLCQEYITQKVDGATFYDKVDAYKEKLMDQDIYKKEEEEDNTGTVNKIFANASKFKYLIVGVIVSLGVVITVVVIKRKENV